MQSSATDALGLTPAGQGRRILMFYRMKDIRWAAQAYAAPAGKQLGRDA